MGKKDKRGSTIENRVYLFKDLAAAYLGEHGAGLGSSSASEVARARRALAEIARASCIVADTADLSADEVAERVARAPAHEQPAPRPPKRPAPPAKAKAKRKTAKKGSGSKRRGWGGGHGGG